jgi:hypothetical protein
MFEVARTARPATSELQHIYDSLLRKAAAALGRRRADVATVQAMLASLQRNDLAHRVQHLARMRHWTAHPGLVDEVVDALALCDSTLCPGECNRSFMDAASGSCDDAASSGTDAHIDTAVDISATGDEFFEIVVNSVGSQTVAASVVNSDIQTEVSFAPLPPVWCGVAVLPAPVPVTPTRCLRPHLSDESAWEGAIAPLAAEAVEKILVAETIVSPEYLQGQVNQIDMPMNVVETSTVHEVVEVLKVPEETAIRVQDVVQAAPQQSIALEQWATWQQHLQEWRSA